MGGGNPASLPSSPPSGISYSTVSVRVLHSPIQLPTYRTTQTEDMVEIKRTLDEESAPLVQDELDTKYRLLYTKSKVYVNPSAYSRDNIPGFVALVKRVRQVSHNPFCRAYASLQEAVNPVYLLSWIPETLLNEKGPGEWDKFVHTEEKSFFQDEDEGRSDSFPC